MMSFSNIAFVIKINLLYRMILETKLHKTFPNNLILVRKIQTKRISTTKFQADNYKTECRQLSNKMSF